MATRVGLGQILVTPLNWTTSKTPPPTASEFRGGVDEESRVVSVYQVAEMIMADCYFWLVASPTCAAEDTDSHYIHVHVGYI